MENEMTMRIVPYVRFITVRRNGRLFREEINNLSNEEIKNMSCLPRMLWHSKNDEYYVAELPLTHRGTALKWSLCYVYDELTKEEQEAYLDRSIVVKTIRPDVVQIYNDPKVKTKSPKA